MRKIKKQSNHLIRMVALLALLLVGVNAAFAEELQANAMPTADANYGSNGRWENSSSLYTWTGNSDNLMPLFTFDAGTLSKYEKIQLNVTKQSGDYPYRIVFLNSGGTVLGTIACYSDGNKDLNILTNDGTKNIDFSAVTSIKFGGASSTGSITITPSSVKLISKPKVTFSTPKTYGATIPDGCLTAKIKDTETVVNNGDYVSTGTVVVFTAKQFSNNAANNPVPEGRLVLQGWKINGSETVDKTNIPASGIVWSDATSAYEATINSDFDIKTEYGFSYVLKIQSAEHGSATAKIGGTTINQWSGFRGNTTVTITASPNDGYALDHWNVCLNGAGDSKAWPTDKDYEDMGSDNPFNLLVTGSTFGNAWGNDVIVIPVFKSVTNYTVNFGAIDTNDASTSMGSVTATKADGTVLTSGQSVEEGTVVTFTATPASSDYLAWGWKENGTRNYQGTTVTRTITADITMNAVFNAGITLTAIQSTNSTKYGTTRIECSGDRGTSFHTNPGTPNVQFIATPKTGATFEGWYSDDACNTLVSNDNPYIIASPDASTDLYAKFTVPEGTYAIEWSANIPEGCDAWFTVNGDETKKYKESVFGLNVNDELHYYATDIDNPAKMIASWTVGSAAQNVWYNDAKSRAFYIDGNTSGKTPAALPNNWFITLQPNFEDAYTYTATATTGCTVSVIGDNAAGTLQKNVNGVKVSKEDTRTKITLSTSSSDGLTFDGWYEDGVKINEAAATYVIDITQDANKKDRSFEARYNVPAPIGGQRVKAQLANLAKGNVPTWENGHMATDATSYNHVDIFRFPNVPDGNINVSNSADNYTGIRFHAKGPKVDGNDTNSTPFRVLVYVEGETNARITNIPASNKEYVYTWTDLGVPAANIADITRVCFAGQQNGPTDVIFDNVWVEKIDDPCHTFVTYGDDIASFNYGAGTLTYTLPTPEGNATAVFDEVNKTGNSRKGYTNELRIDNTLVITAPTSPSEKRIKAIKLITDVEADKLLFTADNGTNAAYSKEIVNGYEVIWSHDNAKNVTITNVGGLKANIAKIEVIYDNGKPRVWDAQKHPAFIKHAPGEYVANLDKINSYQGYAYDAETHTIYSSSTAAWGGNINIQFEEPQDLTNLTKMALGYEGVKNNIVTFIDFVPTEGGNITFDISGIDDWNQLTIPDDVKNSLNGKLIKQITFASSQATSGSLTLSYIGFNIGHMAPKVALNDPSKTEYTIGVGQSVNLSAHATQGEGGTILWSGWKSATPSEGPVDDQTKRWWVSDGTYKFTGTEEGTFYFGARLEQDCTNHGGTTGVRTANADAAIITVHVVKNNIYENLNLDFTGNTYTEDGWAKGRQYRIYVPQSICNGTTEEKKNVPVVFSLHGTSNNNNPDEGGLQNFNELAEQHKFIVVYPNGRLHIDGLWGRGWEATGKENEDTKFFRAIIADLNTDRAEFKLGGTKQFTSIDESRIYMTGFSNGGMMAYAEANTSANIFAAFGSISGYPINEMHMRHHNDRPVPFIHIHGTKDTFVKYSHMPTIVDNMLFRNGLAITPNEIGEGSANGGATRYKMSSYTDGEAPYVYYEIGTGSNTSDTGMGHESQCTIGDKTSMQVIWEFFFDKTLPNPVENPFEFKARINTANNLARDHGWQTNTSSGILAQYGESGGYTTTEENVYHTIHLTNGDKNGKHSIQFTAKGTSTNYVMVKVTKLADFTEFNTMGKHSFAVNENVILNNVAYYVRPETDGGVISIPFEGTEGEYMITITKGGKWDNTTLEDVAIVEGEVNKGVTYDKPVDTNFGGYFNYNNRLFAQWNFDLSDGYRTNARKLQANADEHNDNRAWTANLSNTDYNGTTLNNGTVVFSNHKALGTHIGDDNYNTDLSTYDELTYNGTYVQGATNNNLIAAAAGLKFKAPAESVKIYVDIANGQVSGAHLVVNENVKMYIPYVENSYRNDMDQFSQPQDHKDDFKNCMHHINRDIIYIALNQGSIWDEWNNGHFISQGHVKNKCIDLDEDLFRNGGDEFVNGKNYNKADYMGKAGTPCILQFNRETNIDRIGVNRNLIYSFYTEYIAELGKTKPSTRFRVVGNPQGQKIANDGDTWTEYTGAIAMTYGGWLNSKGGSSYKKYDNVETTDAWTDLGVMNYEPDNSDIHFKTWGNMQPAESGTNTMPSIDGFPVVALLDTEARSGSLLPQSLAPYITKTENGVDYVTEQDKEGNDVFIPNYYPQCDGKFMDPVTVGAYKANITPWSLPSRGGYAKFEPSLPGVLNMNVVQKGGCAYFIADEFGKLVDQSTIFSRTGSGQTISKANNCYTVTKTDYVKHSLNVEPGKTYYIFSNDAGLGLAGFYFEPYVNHDGTERGRINIGVREMNLSAGTAYALPDNVSGSETITSPGKDGAQIPYTINYSRKAVKVNLRRAFHKNQWETICLPYSMNQVQMEQAFGPGTRVVLLRDIQDADHSIENKVTCTLVCHENQDIIAGYPYLIRPTEDALNGVVTIASLPETNNMPDLVSVSSAGPNTNSYEEKTYGGIGDYTFKGHYGGKADVKKGSYAVVDGLLKRVTDTKISGYRAWIDLNTALSQAKKIAFFVGADGQVDGDATAIDEIDIDAMLEQQGIFANKTTVYSIDGHVVRENATNLNGLAKGIYIVNGKKYVVK